VRAGLRRPRLQDLDATAAVRLGDDPVHEPVEPLVPVCKPEMRVPLLLSPVVALMRGPELAVRRIERFRSRIERVDIVAEKDQTRNAFRIAGREIQAVDRAERLAHDVSAFYAEVVENIDGLVDDAVLLERPRVL